MKKNYYFSTGKIDDALQIVFLCGSKYDDSNKYDKRSVLSKYILESKNPKKSYYPIILEKNFAFKQRTTKKKNILLGYNTIGLSSLSEIETLMSIISDSIIIFHESFSTAGEIALFASLPDAAEKVHVFIPSPTDVEEDYLQGFLKLAFTGFRQSINYKLYYPSINSMRLSPNIGKYYTSFDETEFCKNVLLKNQIDEILNNSTNKSVILEFEEIDPLDYIYSQKEYSFASKCYWLSTNNTSSDILIFIPFRLLKIIVFSFLIRSETRNILRTKKKLIEIAKDISEVIIYTITNTYNINKGTTLNVQQVKIEVGDLRDYSMIKLVMWCLYMLHGMSLITINNMDDETEIIISSKDVTEEIDMLNESYGNLLKDLSDSKAGKLFSFGDEN